MTFPERYPLASNEVLHFPMMFPEFMKRFHIPGIPLAKLDFLYEFGEKAGFPPGTVRTALSRLKSTGYITVTKTGIDSRYRVSPLQLEIMNNMKKRITRHKSGFCIVVYSFEKQQEKERALVRSLLEYAGFVRFAQNAYINMLNDESELRKKIDETGSGANVYLFKVDCIPEEDIAKISLAWKIPERHLFLNDFYVHVTDFIEQSDGSDADIFYRIGYAWVAFIIRIQSTELPLPEKMLPKDYAYSNISDYLNKCSIREGRTLMSYFLNKNR